MVIVVGVFVVFGIVMIDLSDEVLDVVERLGYLIMIKVMVGGGGMGFKMCYSFVEVIVVVEVVRSRVGMLFYNLGFFVEKYV